MKTVWEETLLRTTEKCEGCERPMVPTERRVFTSDDVMLCSDCAESNRPEQSDFGPSMFRILCYGLSAGVVSVAGEIFGYSFIAHPQWLLAGAIGLAFFEAIARRVKTRKSS